ncbi:MAG: PrsW family intramembrane metalloprotease [Treponema sp.]|jgi:RsiW-degrading membrane proteinase PrsW (M82 family)|nr:PrsW family intramembrane metalloprotease [Treponema sp.]
MGVLFLLIFISALPVIAAFLWFRRRQFPTPTLWFLLCLLAGVLSLSLAAVAQYIMPPAKGVAMKDILFNVFIRIALVEEGSKLLIVLIILQISGKLLKMRKKDGDNFTYGTAAGLIAGLGFAMIESASYGASDMRIAVLRAFTAAPLHGACGARDGSAADLLKTDPRLAIWRFLSATAIHGAYNMLVVSPGHIQFLSVLLSFTSLLSATRLLYKKEKVS